MTLAAKSGLMEPPVGSKGEGSVVVYPLGGVGAPVVAVVVEAMTVVSMERREEDILEVMGKGVEEEEEEGVERALTMALVVDMVARVAGEIREVVAVVEVPVLVERAEVLATRLVSVVKA